MRSRVKAKTRYPIALVKEKTYFHIDTCKYFSIPPALDQGSYLQVCNITVYIHCRGLTVF